jgi:hypothetical protein
LNQICKGYKRNKKAEKEKEKEEIKIEKGLREPFRPRSETSPQPRKGKPESVSSLSLAR